MKPCLEWYTDNKEMKKEKCYTPAYLSGQPNVLQDIHLPGHMQWCLKELL